MLSNECQRFLNYIAKIQNKLLKTVEIKKDAAKEDVARVIYEFELSVLKNIERVQSKKDVVNKFKEKSDLMF